MVIGGAIVVVVAYTGVARTHQLRDYTRLGTVNGSTLYLFLLAGTCTGYLSGEFLSVGATPMV